MINLKNKTTSFCSNFESQLDSKLAHQAEEFHNFQLKIDKLQFDNRQANLCASSLKKQIEDQVNLETVQSFVFS